MSAHHPWLLRCALLLRRWLPALYVLGALPIWWSFFFSPREMWASFWLYIYTLPVSMLGNIWLMPGEFPFFPGEYFMAHSLYFACAVLMIAALLWLVLQLCVRLLSRCQPPIEPQ